MTRILSAAILLPILFGTVWYLPPIGTLVLAEIAALLAFVEYASPGCVARHACPAGPVRSRGPGHLRVRRHGSQCDRDRPADRARDNRRARRWRGTPRSRHPGRSSRGAVPGAVHWLATRRAGGRPAGRTGRRRAAGGRDHRQRLGAVLHGPCLRPSPARAGHQSQEDGRGRDWRCRAG